MRRKMRIRVAFSPTRLPPEHLRAAYDSVVPVRKVAVRTENENRITSHHCIERVTSKGGRAS